MSSHFVCLYFLFVLIVVARCNGYQQCSVRPLQRHPDANARFSFIGSIRESKGDEDCKEIKASGIMMIVAIDYVVSRLNNATLVPGVKFGYDVYDDCGIDRYSTQSALDAMSYYLPSDLKSCTENSSTYYLGILGPTRSQTAEQVLSIVEHYDIPVVSPAATSPDLRNSPNFFRTVPSDDDQVNVFIRLMEEHKWNYVVAMHTDDKYGQNGISKIVELAKARNICVKVIHGFKTTEKFDNTAYKEGIYKDLLSHIDNTTDKTLGILYFGQRYVIQRLLTEIQYRSDKLTKLRDIKWIMSESIGTRVSVFAGASDITKDAMTVSMPTLNVSEVIGHLQTMWSSSDDVADLVRKIGPFSSDDWKDNTVSVLDATFAITTSLKTAFDKKCTGYKVICEGFDAYYNSNKLESMNTTIVNYTSLGLEISPSVFYDKHRVVTFDAQGDLEPDPYSKIYDVNMYTEKKMNKVGEYRNNSFQAYSEFPSSYTTSTCQKGCESCVETPNIPFEFIEGDVYLLGFFSLHRSEGPFGCGEFRNLTFDVFSVEAFLNSILEARNETGVMFGGIAFDDCYSPIRASMITSDIFSGKLKVPTLNPIDPARIVGVIGPFPSGVTVPVTFLFSSLGLPSVSYASTSPDLDDKDINFPYFFRTVPSDVDQANAMVKILKEMKWYSTGLVYVANNYGSKGRDAFKKMANASGICIVSEIEVSQKNSTNENYKVSKKLKDTAMTGTNLFIYFGTEGRMVDVLSHIKAYQTESETNKFVFIGSDDWADSRNIKDMFGDMVEGSVTFKIKTKSTNTNFVANLVQKTSSVRTASYWYKEFYRSLHKCYFEDDFVRKYSKKCPKDTTFRETSGILADGRVSHCILAVKALTKGIAQAKLDLCQGESTFPCLQYIRHLDLVRDRIANVTLSDNEISYNIFDQNRNGDVGFQLLQIKKDVDNYGYSEVGSYDHDYLVLKSNRIKDITGDKLSVANCAATNPSTNDLHGSTDESSGFRIAEIVIIALLATFFVVLIIVIGTITYCFLRKFSDLHKMLDETKHKITSYNEIGTPRKHKSKHSSKKNGDVIFDNSIFMNGDLNLPEPPGQHYLPLQESEQGHTSHGYDGERLDILHQTVLKQSVSAYNQSLPAMERPDLPPRNVTDKKVMSKSESDIHNSFPIIKPKMGNYNCSVTNQPRMGTAMQSTPTDSLHSLHSQGSVFGGSRSQIATTPDNENLPSIIVYDKKSPSKSLPSSPRSPYERNKTLSTSTEKHLPSQSSPLSHKSSIHSQFSGDTLHMTGNLKMSPQRIKRLKSFSSEEPQKISRV